MPEPQPPAHLDDEALSALLDGESVDAAHLGGCAQCVQRLDQLRAVSTALATPPPALDARRADSLVAAALQADGGAAGRPDPRDHTQPAAGATVTPLEGRRRAPAKWLAIAAVALVALAAVPILAGGRSGDRDTLSQASGRVEAESGTGGNAGPEAGTGAFSAAEDRADTGAESMELAGGPVSDGDLGPRNQLDEVARAVRGRLDTPSGGDDTGPPVVARCEASARGGDAEVGALVYVATLTWRGVEAEALAFRLDDAPGAYRLAIMARSGCGLLDRGRI